MPRHLAKAKFPRGFKPGYRLTQKMYERVWTPDGFAEAVLGMDLYEKQREFLRACAFPGCYSFAVCNEGGKTSRVLPALVLWHMFFWPKGKVDCTSGSFRQLKDQAWPALNKYRDKFEHWKWNADLYIETDEKGFFRGFSTDNPGRAEGDHADGDDAPLLYIVDEAKSAPPWLAGVVEGRVRPTRTVLMSSHGFAEGWFYESQTTLQNFVRVNQTADDTPHITKATIKSVEERWKGAPDFANSILGRGFMPLVQDAIIRYKDLDACIAHPPEFQDGETHAFCDFAWSNDGDENVLAVRVGNRITIEHTFHAEKLHDICDEFVAEFSRLGLQSGQISGDEGGGGQQIIDELENRGWFLNRINNGFPANDSEHFKSVAAEMWFNFSTQVINKKLILPNDQEMRGQMVNRKRVANPGGKIAIESKKEMKKRGVMSPDRADSVIGCAAPGGGYGLTTCSWAKASQFGAAEIATGTL